MNFLSHFYHEYPGKDPYFVAGLLLPDILSNYSYRNGEVVKLHAEKLAGTAVKPLDSLNQGVRQHYLVDRLFHGSDFFDLNVEMIKTRIIQHDPKAFGRRLFAFAHVLLELVLDRTILRKEPAVCDDMYSLLDGVELTILQEFIAMNTAAKAPAHVAQHFEQFRQIKFVYDYSNDDRLSAILNSVNMRLGNPALPTGEISQLKSIIHDVENAILAQKFPKFRTDN